MSKKLFNAVFLLGVFSGILFFIATREIIISLLFIISGSLFKLAGNSFINVEEWMFVFWRLY